MAKGIGAFKQAQYPQAVDHFRSAVELDVGCTTARLYLAAVREQFDKVLERDQDNALALASAASLSFNEQKLDEATIWDTSPVGPEHAVEFLPTPGRRQEGCGLDATMPGA